MRPPVRLVVAVAALPIVSIVLISAVVGRVGIVLPEALPIIDALRAAALVTLVLGLGLVFAIPVGLAAGRTRPGVMLWILRSGVPTGIRAVAVMVILHTILACAVVLIVEFLTFGQTFNGSVAVLIIGGLAAAVYLATSGTDRLRRRRAPLAALVVGRDAAPGVQAMVAGVAERMGMQPPDAILISDSFACWAARGTFDTIDGKVSGDVIHLSLPLMAVFSTSAMEAVAAHELAHIWNGDVLGTPIVAEMVERLVAGIGALDEETENVQRVVAYPGLIWLRYVGHACLTAVLAGRAASEAAADAVAAEIVGPQAMADTLAATLSTLSLEPIWHVSAHKRDARGALTKLVRANRRLAATKGSGDEPDSDRLPATDGAMSDETRSAVTARIVLLGSTPAAYEPPQQAALDALAGEDAVPMLTRILAPAGPAARWVEGEQFNPPRLTPGLVGWVLSGLTLFPVLFFVWLPQFHRHFVENLIFVVALFALWVWFLPTYLLLQREFDLSADGVRARAWLWAIRDGRRHGRNCHLLHWDGPLRVSISALQIMRLTDGRESVRASIEMWRRREVYSFFDAVRSRGGSVRFSRFSGGTDDERQIVIWLAGDSFILPDVRRAPDGRLLEFEPIRQIPIDVFRLADELRKRLSSRVKVVGSGRTLATEGRLAAAAAVEPGAFSDNARRITIEGFRSGVTIRVGDDPGRFVAGSSPHPAVVSMGVFLALGLVGSEADDDDVDDQRDPN